MSDKLRAAAQAVRDAKEILFLRDMSVHDKVYLRLEDASNAIKAALAEPAIKESLIAQRPWVGLADEDFEKEKFVDFNFLAGASFAAAKLKEKNGG